MKLQLRSLRFTSDWQGLLPFCLALAGVAALLWWQLGVLTAGYSPQELSSLHNSLSLKHIFNNPVNAPFHVLATGFYRILGDSLLAVRVTAALFGLASFGIFYWLVRFWHGARSALIGSALFGSSAWFLHTSRLGTPDVLLFLLLGLVGCAVWVQHSKSSWPLLFAFILATGLLYVPGMVWFILLGVLWYWKRIDRLFKKRLGVVTIGAVLVVAAIAPLGWAIFHNLEIGKQVLGLPAEGWPTPMTALRALIAVPLAIVWRVPFDPTHWLGRLPLTDVFTLAMFCLGLYVYARHARLGRSTLIALVFALGSLLIALGGGVSLSIIVPFVYIVAAVGADFMLEYWYRIFPRNVIAQGVGALLLSFAIIIAVWYNLRHYYVAWPNAPETRAAFSVHEQ